MYTHPRLHAIGLESFRLRDRRHRKTYPPAVYYQLKREGVRKYYPGTDERAAVTETYKLVGVPCWVDRCIGDLAGADRRVGDILEPSLLRYHHFVWDYFRGNWRPKTEVLDGWTQANQRAAAKETRYRSCSAANVEQKEVLRVRARDARILADRYEAGWRYGRQATLPTLRMANVLKTSVELAAEDEDVEA